MTHETPLIATIAVGLGAALVLGVIATRLKLSPIVGFLCAGIVVGPFTPGFVGDAALAAELSEIGVILLMFGVGLHFSLDDLLSVKRIAVPGAIVQIAFATALGVVLGEAFGWPLGAGLILGLALSVASTVVLLRALEERRLLTTEEGRIAMGWLIIEDLIMVLALVLLPAIAEASKGTESTGEVVATLALTLLKISGFVALMLIVGRRAIPWVLARIVRVGSRELFTLAVLAIALGIAFGSAKLFGVSFALGAFFAGMVLNGSELSHDAAANSLPLRDAFAVLFFVSVGMLFNPQVLIDEPLPVLLVCLVILIGKSLAALGIVLWFGYELRTALFISASLAQVGEFSFIICGLGISLGILPEGGRDLVLAGAILSITLNPFMFWAVKKVEPHLGPIERMLGGRLRRERADARAAKPALCANHVILVGHGGVGRRVASALAEGRRRYLVIDNDPEEIVSLRASGVDAIYGNASAAGVLESAHVAGAALLLIALPDAFEAGEVVRRARAANSALEIITRADSEAEVEHLESLGASNVIVGEREIATALASRAVSLDKDAGITAGAA